VFQVAALVRLELPFRKKHSRESAMPCTVLSRLAFAVPRWPASATKQHASAILDTLIAEKPLRVCCRYCA
jgi:hypothetical protein